MTHEHASDPRSHLQATLSYVENALEIFDPENMRYNFDKAPDLKSKIEAQLTALDGGSHRTSHKVR